MFTKPGNNSAILSSKYLIVVVLTIACVDCIAGIGRSKMTRRVAKAICKTSKTFAEENQIQPPIKDPSKFPASDDDPACKVVKIKVDASLCDAGVCSKTFSCSGSVPNIDPPNPGPEPSDRESSDPDPNQTYDDPYIRTRHITVRIVGGKNVYPHELPYQVRLVKVAKSFTFCGGSVLNENFVLSAAHCFRGIYNPGEVNVVAGDHNRLTEEGTEQIRKVIAMKTHENYVYGPEHNDILLLKVSPPFEFNANVQPIQIPPPNFDAYGYALVSGWGLLSSNGGQSEILQKVELPIITDAQCKKAYSHKELHDTTICAGYLKEGKKSACVGDSGGALAQRRISGSYMIVGIVSWGEDCAKPNKPGVYVEVSKYVDWIQTHST